MSHWPALYAPFLSMLFLLFLYYLIQHPSIDAGPIPTVENRSLTGNHCNDLGHCRTIWNIVWSCLVTIFSCTWVAVHPNVPYPKKREGGWFQIWIRDPLLSFAEHRLPLLVCALLVPEFILTWAIRQFLRARKIAHDNEEWTITHGFFIIMGGFHLFERGSKKTRKSPEDGEPIHPLGVEDLLSSDDYEPFSIPTEEEIQDKAKSNSFTKSLVLFQTSWFVMQCIARGIEHLPVTHLEIVTLAYAAVNFAIYLFWWYKPHNVNRPVRVFRKPDPGATQHQVKELTPKTTWKAVLKKMYHVFTGGLNKHIKLNRLDRVPRFWANSTNEQAEIANKGVNVMCGCFGAIHCIAWHFSFPTRTELWIWRISSIAITAEPIYAFSGSRLTRLIERKVDEKAGHYLFKFLVLSGAAGYIFARGITLALAFTSLRDLPPRAYETVHWTTFIPHI